MKVHNEAFERGEKRSKLRINDHADRDHGEFHRKLHGVYKNRTLDQSGFSTNVNALETPPASFDWRDKDGMNYVSEVRNQRKKKFEKNCG